MGLASQERADLLSQTLLVQERDLLVHKLNRERYVLILDDERAPEPFKERIRLRLDEVQERIAEVEAIVRAIKQQV